MDYLPCLVEKSACWGYTCKQKTNIIPFFLINMKINAHFVMSLGQTLLFFSFLVADNFATVFHSLDVWHKSKSIRKCLSKVSNTF